MGQHRATTKMVPTVNCIQVRHVAQLWETTSAARPMQKAFLTASCNTQHQMFPQLNTQCSKICIRIECGEEEIQEFAMDLVEQLRYFALDLEKESETRPPSGEHKSSSLCVKSFVLDHGPTK